jgi:glutamyl-tRNA synthetase
MTLDEMCELFGVERIGKTNARFDREKLLNFNTTAFAIAGEDRKLAAFGDYLSIEDRGPMSGLDDALQARLLEMCPTARIFRDIEEKTAALFAPDDGFAYDPAAVKKTLLKSDGAGLGVLRQMRAELEALADWSGPALEKLIREFAEKRELGLGKVAQPLRVAVTGTTVSPPIFDTLAVLGRERTLSRIDRTLAHAAAQASP